MTRHAFRRLLLPSLCALVLPACDAYILAMGRVQTPDRQPVADATVTLAGWTERTVPVQTDGSFVIQGTHGGRALLRASAPGFRGAVRRLKGTAHYYCTIVLAPAPAPQHNESHIDCKKQ